MKWAEMRHCMRKKLGATHHPGRKHDQWYIYCGATAVGIVLDSHGDGEMKNHEIGNVARSLRINEHDFKELQRCNLSAEKYCEVILAPPTQS